MKQETKSTLIYISNKYFSTLSTFIQNGIVENFLFRFLYDGLICYDMGMTFDGIR